jgi:ribonuclease Z
MKLIMLGTGGLIPTDAAQTACYFLPEVGVLLDAGTGLYRINRYLQTDDIDVYLTHGHGDHTNGLVWLFASFLVKQIQSSPVAVDETNISEKVARANQLLHAVRVHATQTAMDFLSTGYEPYGMNWRLLESTESLPAGGSITWFPTGNADEVGFRLDWPGHSLAYVTDAVARADATYIDSIRGVDVLLHDCNGPDRLAKLMARISHSSTSEVARVAALAQVQRVYLVHSNPLGWSIEEDLVEARKIFPAIQIGVDEMEIEF